MLSISLKQYVFALKAWKLLLNVSIQLWLLLFTVLHVFLTTSNNLTFKVFLQFTWLEWKKITIPI